MKRMERNRLKLRHKSLRPKGRVFHEKRPLSPKRLWLSRALMAAGAVMFVLFVLLTVRYVKDTRRAHETQKELTSAFVAAEPQTEAPAATDIPTPAPAEALTQPEPVEQAPVVAEEPADGEPRAMDPAFISLYKKNNDVVGWLKYAPIQDLNFPVVQRDNAFYFDRDFYGRKSLSGTVFMDEDNSFYPRDTNLILHGHNMKNGTMFGKLNKLMQPALWMAEPMFSFQTLYDSRDYVPYAVSLISLSPNNTRYFSFVQPDFEHVSDMADYVNRLRSLSVIAFPTELREDDKLLTLVTCHGQEDDERLVVALRALRPGEDREQVSALFKKELATKPRQN